MKIIFLDFDGVITTLGSKWRLDLEKMKLVKHICEETDSKIVITSSWRKHNLEETLKHIVDSSNYYVKTPFLTPELVIGITSTMYSFESGSRENFFTVPRGIEIQHWIDTNDVTNYVILDDDSDMLLSQKDHFIQTNTYYGISEDDAKEAIRILNS